MIETTCRCGKPTRDNAYVCDDCAQALSVALGEVPWLAEELEITISGQKAATYNGNAARGAETPSPVHWGASEAQGHLKALLVSWARFCEAEGIRNASPHPAMAADNLPALSRWLMWRVDGLTLHDIGPEAVDEITSAVAHCHRVIDRPADRQYLGACDMCGTGRLYARQGSPWARCDACEAAEVATQRRDRLLDELDDRLCTAAEIAHLSTYLDLRADRETVRKRINQWASRKRIESEHAFSDEPVFRFGIVRRLLEQEEAVRTA